MGSAGGDANDEVYWLIVRWRLLLARSEFVAQLAAPVVYQDRTGLPPTRLEHQELIAVRKDVVYRTTDAGSLALDSYYPAEAKRGARLRVVVFVSGYNDVGVEKVLGCKAKEMAMSVSWGQLAAMSGLAAIAYTNREPAADLNQPVRHVGGYRIPHLGTIKGDPGYAAGRFEEQVIRLHALNYLLLPHSADLSRCCLPSPTHSPIR